MGRSAFRNLVENDLQRGCRLIVRAQDDLDPQMRFATPEGDYHLAITFPPDERGRAAMMERIKLFLAWKQALALTFVCELPEPECVMCIGVSRQDSLACASMIQHLPKPWTVANFGPTQWLDERSIDPSFVDLLPKGAMSVSATDMAELERWFGPKGKFPAVHLPTGQIREI